MKMLKTNKDMMYQPDLGQVNEMTKTIRQKIDTMVKEQTDEKFKKDKNLPIVPRDY